MLIHGKQLSIPCFVKCITQESPNPVLALGDTLGTTLCRSLLVVVANTALPRSLEEQTGTLALLQQMAQVTSVRRVSVVLNVLSAGRVGKPVLEVRAGCGRSSALDAVDGVGVALEDAPDGGFGVVASDELSAGGLDGSDS